MARLLSIGGEEGDLRSIFDYTVATGSAIWSPVHTSYQSSAVRPRTGYACLLFVNENNYSRVTIPNVSELYFGFALLTTGDQSSYPVAGFDGCGIYMRVMSSNTIAFYRSSTSLVSSTSWSHNVWHYLEWYLKPRNSGGVLQVKLDGTLIVDYSGDTADSTEYAQRLIFAGTNESTYFDDIVLNDTSGTANNSWPGQVHLLPVGARAVGDSDEWTRAGVDLGTSLGQVRDLSNGDYALLETSATEKTTLLTVDAPDLPAGATIKNVIAKASARVGSGSGSIALLCKNGGVTSEGTSHALTSGWKLYEEAFAVNPADSGSWEEADLASVQLGIRSK